MRFPEIVALSNIGDFFSREVDGYLGLCIRRIALSAIILGLILRNNEKLFGAITRATFLHLIFFFFLEDFQGLSWGTFMHERLLMQNDQPLEFMSLSDLSVFDKDTDLYIE